MQTSRRDFLRTLGLSGLAVVSLPEIGSATNSIKRSQDSGKRKGLTFLFQGDSITDGSRTRDDGWNHVLGHG